MPKPKTIIVQGRPMTVSDIVDYIFATTGEKVSRKTVQARIRRGLPDDELLAPPTPGLRRDLGPRDEPKRVSVPGWGFRV